jgi:iron complex outermembrane receptor protein
MRSAASSTSSRAPTTRASRRRSYYGDTFDGGAREKSVTATLGFGDLSKDRYNAFVSMQWMKQDAAVRRDRPFSQSSYIPSEGLDSTSGRSFPGNVAVPGVGNRNPMYPNCAPSLAADPRSNPGQCRFDPNPFLGSLPEAEKFNLVARGTFQLTARPPGVHRGPVREERVPVRPAAGADRDRRAVPGGGAGAPGLPAAADSPFYPHDFAAQFGLDGQPLDIQWRAFDAGLRDSTTTGRADAHRRRLQGRGEGLGLRGRVQLQPEQGQRPPERRLPVAGRALADHQQRQRQPVRAQHAGDRVAAHRHGDQGRRALVEVDRSTRSTASQQRDLQPAAGPLAVAFGGEWRKEKYDSVSSEILSSGDIVGYGTSSPTVTRRSQGVRVLPPRRSCRSSRASSSTPRCGSTTTATSARRPTRSCRCAGSRPSSSSRARRTARASARRRCPSCSRRW